MTGWMNTILMLSRQTVQTPELFTFRVLDLNSVAIFELAVSEKLYYKLIMILKSFTTATVSATVLTPFSATTSTITCTSDGIY